MLFCFVLSSVFNMSFWLEKLSNHFLQCRSLTLNKLSYPVLYSTRWRQNCPALLATERKGSDSGFVVFHNKWATVSKKFYKFRAGRLSCCRVRISLHRGNFVLDPLTDVQNVSQRTLAIRLVGERTVNCRLKCCTSSDESSNSRSSKRKRWKRISKSSREVADETF